MKPTTVKKIIKKCFIIMPISTPENLVEKYSGDTDHFIHVLEHLLKPAVKKADFEPIPPLMKGSEHIQGEIIKNIESADFVLCDMSILNPNVFFELGIRTSLNKPVCMIKDDLTENVPFDLKMVNNYSYSSTLNLWTMDKQIEDLANHIKDSFEKSEGSNSLWKLFSLSSTAQPIKEGDSTAKIDFLIKQVEMLREQLPYKNPEKIWVLKDIISREMRNIVPSEVSMVQELRGNKLIMHLNSEEKYEDIIKKIIEKAHNYGLEPEIIWDEF